ncbi:MAG: hypothetical protein IT280_13190 [Ignavibacteria bacterium]|nr:hypothetical protein [Ignavibacteria bacterium]
MRNMSKMVSEKFYGIKEENLISLIIHDLNLSRKYKITEASGFIQIDIFLTSDLEENEVTYKIDFETYHKYLYSKIKQLKGAKK